MFVSHKIQLDPNNKQRTYFAKACGCARFAYNWALEEWEKQYDASKGGTNIARPGQLSLRRQLNAAKREKYPWMLEVTKCAPQMAIVHLGAAFKNFFAKRGKYPTKKKKGRHDSFELTNDQFKICERKIKIPNLGWVRMFEGLRFQGKILSCTVSRQADKWFASINLETSDLLKAEAKNQGAVGINLGINSFAVLSTGDKIEGPKLYKAMLKRARHLSKAVSRKQKGSQNQTKARNRLERLHARIANVRHDFLHKLTTRIAKGHNILVIEDHSIMSKLKEERVARAIADMGFFEFRRQLGYKAKKFGRTLIVAGKYFPSSMLCSGCGHKNETAPLNARAWQCPQCNAWHDRDLNAAVNLMNLAASSAASACVGDSSGFGGSAKAKLFSVKQEANIMFAQA